MATAPRAGLRAGRSTPSWLRRGGRGGPPGRKGASKAAGGAAVPPALKAQLKVGGRLVIPIGQPDHAQELVKLTRRSEQDYEEEHLGAVRFVPLVGGTGWVEDGRRSASRHVPGAAQHKPLAALIAEAAEPLPDFDDRR